MWKGQTNAVLHILKSFHLLLQSRSQIPQLIHIPPYISQMLTPWDVEIFCFLAAKILVDIGVLEAFPRFDGFGEHVEQEAQDLHGPGVITGLGDIVIIDEHTLVSGDVFAEDGIFLLEGQGGVFDQVG